MYVHVHTKSHVMCILHVSTFSIHCTCKGNMNPFVQPCSFTCSNMALSLHSLTHTHTNTYCTRKPPLSLDIHIDHTVSNNMLSRKHYVVVFTMPSSWVVSLDTMYVCIHCTLFSTEGLHFFEPGVGPQLPSLPLLFCSVAVPVSGPQGSGGSSQGE